MNINGIIGHKTQLMKLDSLLKSGMIPNTLLFSGISGIGKKLIARRFLNTLFCKQDKAPCLSCSVCLQIKSGTFRDLVILEPDSKGNIPIGNQDKKEPGTVRWLIDRLTKRAISERCGVIIDGIETISTAGQNALLKTIEEPQKGTVIILLTSNKSLILPTIISRSSEIPFSALSMKNIHTILGGKDIQLDNAEILSRISGGSVETAMLLNNENMMTDILKCSKAITGYIETGEPFTFDITPLQKNIGYENLLHILINIYREIYLSAINGRNISPILSETVITDSQKILKLIKIFLALKKGLLNNLNIKISLKGMLYYINSINEIGIPDLYYM